MVFLPQLWKKWKKSISFNAWVKSQRVTGMTQPIWNSVVATTLFGQRGWGRKSFPFRRSASAERGHAVGRFRFLHYEANILSSIMPGGVPHWVLGTSEALCVGRHFYGASTIRSSVVSIVQTFILGGTVTNDDNLQTRTLLYQMLVFWSMRIDLTDVDGR